ncbi:NADH-quinone oxidoreductase subunit NuoB [Helicovermis profundi]|uniref:4Fe-4S ferredoxin-type domain-containing protein n=1 Tax=Helicovermis profundi TaxID=3065157 RepID=A0AAU9E246_9FIRM|nr:hypothetical protein HLPR_07820 [Clostridia bacterium S502]
MKFIFDRIKNGKETIKNPLESNSNSYGKIIVDTSTCNLCGICEKECISGALKININKVEIDHSKCLFCKDCINSCPKSSLKMTNDYKLSYFEELGNEVRELVYKKFNRSLSLRAVDVGSCNGCFLELSALNNTYYDLSRYGVHMVASPRHADGLIISGALSINMKEAVLKAYEATAEPKIIIVLGACGVDGGIYKKGYAVNENISDIIPVDMFIPGCPPSPSAILEGILKLMKSNK